jgi:hypothetical protein
VEIRGRDADLHPPTRQDLEWFMVCNGSRMSPVEQTPCGICAEKIRAWLDANTTKIKPIRVPTSLQGRITRHQPVCMQSAGFVEQLEARVVQVD